MKLRSRKRTSWAWQLLLGIPVLLLLCVGAFFIISFLVGCYPFIWLADQFTVGKQRSGRTPRAKA